MNRIINISDYEELEMLNDEMMEAEKTAPKKMKKED